MSRPFTQDIFEIDGVKVKWCPDCQEHKSIDNFNKCSTKRSGLQIYCIIHCSSRRKNWVNENKDKNNATQKAWRDRNQHKFSGYKRHQHYKITPEKYEEMIKNQNNKCDICSIAFNDEIRVHVDHDHKCCNSKKSCGKCVRSLLCSTCNIVLGYLSKNPELLKQCAPFFEYLEKWDKILWS